ncbi:hypothetical protein FRZ06_11385 [Anoxybacterium hadale]|uniref:Uncharacterized protein n=1 Tax=Anoxybacterium hadale TaxID=3408580 RepID=A0ACD1AC39_9FIRM|nr:hypothetical protein FRZ06_11385 [Clostridiales bacterium]
MMKLCRKSNSHIRTIMPKLTITKESFDLIINTTKDSPYVETGGILLGKDHDPKTVEIMYATLPGPKAYHSPTKFIRDTEYCKKVLNEYYEKKGLDYIGEWHSHIIPLRGASGGDFATLCSIMNDPDYNFKAFSCIIALLNNDSVELIGYVLSNKYIYKAKIQILD